MLISRENIVGIKKAKTKLARDEKKYEKNKKNEAE